MAKARKSLARKPRAGKKRATRAHPKVAAPKKRAAAKIRAPKRRAAKRRARKPRGPMVTYDRPHRLRWGATLEQVLAWSARLSASLELMPRELAQLAKLPAPIQRAVRACRRRKNRYWSVTDWRARREIVANAPDRATIARKLRRFEIMPPRRPPGAGEVVAAVAAAAGTSAPSLYRWRQEAHRARLFRKRPRGHRRASG